MRVGVEREKERAMDKEGNNEKSKAEVLKENQLWHPQRFAAVKRRKERTNGKEEGFHVSRCTGKS